PPESGLPRDESRGRSGVIQGLLGLFRRRPKKGKKAASPPAIDRTLFRQRAADLLRQVQTGTNPSVPVVFATLAAVVSALEKLFEDLVAAGDRDNLVERLGRVVLEIRALLAEANPVESAIREVHSRAEAVLRDWLALVPEPPTPPEQSRDKFWK